VDSPDVIYTDDHITSHYTHVSTRVQGCRVLDYDLQRQLMDEMAQLSPLPSVYYPDFIAANQSDRANNVLEGSKQDHLDTVRRNIRDFKASNGLDKVIVLWTANTERFCEVTDGVNDTAENLLRAIQ
ncbi:ISYNA1, partial [Symbiodinium microadriaticum]